MKKNLFIITGIFILIMAILTLILFNIRSNNIKLQKINVEYEYFLNKEIYGTELATLINKAVDSNKRLNIEKDKEGLFIQNETDSILISVKMMDNEEEFRMEKIFALGTDQFVMLFNTSKFKSEQVTYHERTGRIATILFKQIGD